MLCISGLLGACIYFRLVPLAIEANNVVYGLQLLVRLPGFLLQARCVASVQPFVMWRHLLLRFVHVFQIHIPHPPCCLEIIHCFITQLCMICNSKQNDDNYFFGSVLRSLSVSR